MRYQNIASRLYILRVCNDYSCDFISKYLSISINDYQNIESDELEITIDQLIKLSILYNVSVHSILFRNHFES